MFGQVIKKERENHIFWFKILSKGFERWAAHLDLHPIFLGLTRKVPPSWNLPPPLSLLFY